MITGHQVRAARALLNWSGDRLVEETGLNRDTIHNIEHGKVQARGASAEKILQVFTDHGIEFDGDRGVAFKSDIVATLKGENVFFRILDDVMATLRKKPKDKKKSDDDEEAPYAREALFACVVDGVSPAVVIENYRRLRKEGISMRSLVKEGDTDLLGKIDEYRYLPEKYFHNNAVVIYGNKVATMILDPESGADIAAVIINNPHIAAAQRNLFNYIWSISAKPAKSTSKVKYDE